jgi:hypothetical protein
MNHGAANPLAMASRLRPPTRRGSSAAATPRVAGGRGAAPSAVQERMRTYIRQLEQRFPLLRSARLMPERRGVSKAGVYDERTRIGMQYGLTGRAPDGAPIQLDWITPDGFIIDIKMRATGRETGRGQRPDEGLPDEVGWIGSPRRRPPRPLFHREGSRAVLEAGGFRKRLRAPRRGLGDEQSGLRAGGRPRDRVRRRYGLPAGLRPHHRALSRGAYLAGQRLERV